MNFSAWFRETVASAAASIVFILRNLWRGRRLRPLASRAIGEVILGPCRTTDLAEATALYASLTGGSQLSFQMRILLRLRGACFCLTARQRGDGALIGISLFCFNAYDEACGLEGTIHEACIGLQPAARGAGLGTCMRRHALEHFARAGLACVSSRISTGNLPSLKGNLKLGFVPIETYVDAAMAEQRQYLICRLDRYR